MYDASGFTRARLGSGALCVAWAPNGTFVAWGGTDKRVSIVAVGGSKEGGTFQTLTDHAGPVSSIALWAAPSGQLLLASGGGDGDYTIRLWVSQDASRPAFKAAAVLSAHKAAVTCLAAAPTGAAPSTFSAAPTPA